MFPVACTARHTKALADGRVLAVALDLPAGNKLQRVVITAAYCPAGGTNPKHAASRHFRTTEAAVREAVHHIMAEARQDGVPVILGTDGNAILSPLDTWSAHAEPRAQSCVARWVAAGMCDTYRALHPTQQVATHYATHGSSASRLHYILSTAPQYMAPVAAAIHVYAVWPFDLHRPHRFLGPVPAARE